MRKRVLLIFICLFTLFSVSSCMDNKSVSIDKIIANDKALNIEDNDLDRLSSLLSNLKWVDCNGTDASSNIFILTKKEELDATYSLSLEYNDIYKLVFDKGRYKAYYCYLSNNELKKLNLIIKPYIASQTIDYYTISNLILNLNNIRLDDIEKIKCITGSYKAQSGSFNNIQYTIDSSDIKGIYHLITNYKLTKSKLAYNDFNKDKYIIYDIFTKDMKYDLLINDRYLINGNEVYEFMDSLPEISNPSIKCKSFVYYINKFFAHDSYGNGNVPYNNLNRFEFVESNYDLTNKTIIGTIDTEFSTLEIYTNKVFKYNDCVFELVGEIDFSIVDIFQK